MSDLMQQYRNKLVSAADAVKIVKDGDWVKFGYQFTKPIALDMELAKRKDELHDVYIFCSTNSRKVHCIEADPTTKHFCYNTGHMSASERAYHDQGVCYYIPSQFAQTPDWNRKEYFTPGIAMLNVAPMDKNGFFNFGPNATSVKSICDASHTVIVEINPSQPRALGGFEEAIHISQVDMIVEDPRADLPPIDVRPAPISEIDRKIAGFIVPEIPDRACLQIGIGGLPLAIGEAIAESDLKDLGIHSEMINEAMFNIYKSGKITGKYKTTMPGKITYAFGTGSKEFYEWIDDNPALASCPVNYTNQPQHIMANDNFISINNCIEVDLTGQVCSESKGTRMISGSGGQLDFALGAFYSKGGKSILALTSTYDKKGDPISRIVPTLSPGAVVTTPRPVVHYLATEQGIVNLKGKSEWQRAEMIISLAHPDYRDDLIKEAHKLGLWRRTARLV